MSRLVVLLSGPIAAGKTTLCDELRARFGLSVFKTRELIRRLLPDVPPERGALQRAGERLDRRTKGGWVASSLAQGVDGEPGGARGVVVDSVRIKEQINGVRRAYGPQVVHVHLTADERVLRARYKRRRTKARIRELPSFEQARMDPTEAGVDGLAAFADIVIDTGKCPGEDVLVRVASRLGLYGRRVEPLVDVLIGGQYGSEGKGHIASYLAPEYDYLVRVGGPNAGHKVYEEPRPYTHHQLPSGTRRTEAGLIIGPGAVLSVPNLLREIADCKVAVERLMIDPRAVLIEGSDITFEKRSLEGRIGSTAQGVGRATSRKVLRSAARPKVRLAGGSRELKPYLRETLRVLDDAFSAGKRIFLEGTQGTGLSLHHGDFPFVTSRDTSGSGCLAEAGIAPARVRRTIMVVRSYPIRVESPPGGTSGPMGIELRWKEIARRSGLRLPELLKAERTSTTDKRRRVAEFSWSLLRKAVTLNGPTDIALTFVDYIAAGNAEARRFEQLSEETLRFVEEIECVAFAPVSLIATRFDHRSIIDRRMWRADVKPRDSR